MASFAKIGLNSKVIEVVSVANETLKDAKKVGLKGIVLKSKKNIVLDKKNVISYANRNKIFIYVI